MNKQQFQQMLHELATQTGPSNLDLWPVIQARLILRSPRTQRTQFIPATHWGWLGFALAALFIFSITAYAATPVINRLLQMDERLKHADPARLGQPLDLSETINSVTITMQWAYADVDRVLVGYTIHNSDGRRFDPYHETLTDASGITFQWQGGYGVTGQSEILQVTLPPGEGTFIGIFDNIPDLSTAFGVLNVRFTVYAQELNLPSTEAILPTIETTEAGVVVAQVQPMPAGAIIGPFSFEFTIPVVSSSQSR
jgi:hypothetical protein